MSATLKLRNVVAPIVLALVLVGAYYEIFYGPNRALNIVGAITLALGLFALRKHYRLTYGFIEIGFRIFVLTYNWQQGRGAFSSAFSTGFDRWVWEVIFIQNFAAIYVLIR